jgi:Ca2+-transporting ATPase
VSYPDDGFTGLTSAEARVRLERDGYNELPAGGDTALWRIALGLMREPMFALLTAAALVYLFIGDLGEALLLAAFATISVTIAIVQQGRSERALDALRDLASPRALVWRDGSPLRIPGREVVRGDVVLLAEGDRIPADGTLVSPDLIEVDESLVTGESLAVPKQARADPPTSRLLGGTLVTQGRGCMQVTATGARSAIGAIGQSLGQLSREQPRLQRETRRLVVVFGLLAVVLCTVAVVAYGWLRGSWLEALLGGIALGMALLPEEFPLVLTVFMVMGAWRLSRTRVLTRRAAAIETLGAATVLCTDKTGTLTRNVMSVAYLAADGESWSPTQDAGSLASSPALARLLSIASLASAEQPIDPMERAIAALELRAGTAAARSSLVREYPLSAQRLAVTRVWRLPGTEDLVVAAKGAPETVARLCSLSQAETDGLRRKVETLAADGARVLGVAVARMPAGELPSTVEGFPLRFLGIVAFADPLRDTVPDAVRECRRAGIRVVMITGDHLATGRAIARRAGIEVGEAMAGADIDALGDAALAERVGGVAVFARVTPGQKLRIVQALKARGDIVAMTGDGVNDAPALKAAHIGIAMGGRGTDVAREAASIVLLDDDFGSIVRAVRLGRRIYDNLRKAMGYILAIHVPIAGLALLPVLTGWPLILTPMLIAMLELIIDPACSVILEAEREEADVMDRPPRRSDSSLLSLPLILWSLLQGAGAMLLVGGALAWSVLVGMPDTWTRSTVFLALVGANLALIFVNRSFSSSLREAFGRPNAILWWGVGIVVAVLGLVFAVPPARAFLGLGAVSPRVVSWAIASALLLLGLLELAKRPWRRRLQR